MQGTAMTRLEKTDQKKYQISRFSEMGRGQSGNAQTQARPSRSKDVVEEGTSTPNRPLPLMDYNIDSLIDEESMR